MAEKQYALGEEELMALPKQALVALLMHQSAAMAKMFKTQNTFATDIGDLAVAHMTKTVACSNQLARDVLNIAGLPGASDQ
jgi:hypothetical protein